MQDTLRFLGFAILFVFLSSCAPTQKTQDRPTVNNAQERLSTALFLNDLNERAFAYHHYCLRKDEDINPRFMENFEIAMKFLFDASMDTGLWNPEYVVNQVVQRRNNIQRTLANHYNTKGCGTSEAQTALSHYRAFSRMKPEDIESFKIN